LVKFEKKRLKIIKMKKKVEE